MTEYCSNCGVLCCGNLKIEMKRGIYSSFCSYCFNYFQLIDLKTIRKILKQNNRLCPFSKNQPPLKRQNFPPH